MFKLRKNIIVKIVQGDHMNFVFVYENQSTLNKYFEDSLLVLSLEFTSYYKQVRYYSLVAII